MVCEISRYLLIGRLLDRPSYSRLFNRGPRPSRFGMPFPDVHLCRLSAVVSVRLTGQSGLPHTSYDAHSMQLYSLSVKSQATPNDGAAPQESHTSASRRCPPQALVYPHRGGPRQGALFGHARGQLLAHLVEVGSEGVGIGHEVPSPTGIRNAASRTLIIADSLGDAKGIAGEAGQPKTHRADCGHD